MCSWISRDGMVLERFGMGFDVLWQGGVFCVCSSYDVPTYFVVKQCYGESWGVLDLGCFGGC